MHFGAALAWRRASIVVETEDPRRFDRGVRGLTIRITKAINRVLGRVGRVGVTARGFRDGECR
jgi:hypothetical protein